MPGLIWPLDKVKRPNLLIFKTFHKKRALKRKLSTTNYQGLSALIFFWRKCRQMSVFLAKGIPGSQEPLYAGGYYRIPFPCFYIQCILHMQSWIESAASHMLSSLFSDVYQKNMRLWALKIKAHVTVTPELGIATM